MGLGGGVAWLGQGLGPSEWDGEVLGEPPFAAAVWEPRRGAAGVVVVVVVAAAVVVAIGDPRGPRGTGPSGNRALGSRRRVRGPGRRAFA